MVYHSIQLLIPLVTVETSRLHIQIGRCKATRRNKYRSATTYPQKGMGKRSTMRPKKGPNKKSRLNQSPHQCQNQKCRLCAMEKNMKKLFVVTGEDKVPHVLYNQELPLTDRAKMENLLFFPSALSAANFLGVPPQKVFTKRAGGSLKSKINNVRYAVRIAVLHSERC